MTDEIKLVFDDEKSRAGSPRIAKRLNDEGWLYLVVVLELYSRKAIGWAMAERMTTSLVCDALIMGL
ncbi:DDE-type integrase/transposase/recombinase [Methylomonas koyamae]|uniref:DDE-type integrase/transposase/recombinase n=1 Tax=Methylomonas koyamae TaxID=702114 RepID=UPI002873B78B|nr:DDE-type integrase/transposase/recombinase [Methylomonas koyamae]WNB75349.1 hypothetical protein RI210_19035 [Methylomonas koyamae]